MLIVVIILEVLICALVVFLLTRKTGIDGALADEFGRNRKEFASANKELRLELSERVESLRDKNDAKLEQIRKTVETRLEALQKDNGAKLELMRATVDEKLQSTLEKRLSQSFKVVSERLEQVHKGLGEMQNLATNVNDFKRVLTNVKTRGTWGEVQLESLLDQVFIKDHYQKQVRLKPGSNDAVDFAIKLPDKSNKNGFIFLPIDAKFPLEDYQRLVTAEEKGLSDQMVAATKALISRVKLEAKSIHDKYVVPPITTDFAVMYVPIESMYAEILRQPGLFEQLQHDYRVTVAGPTTIAAILSSYQLGFRTLAIAEQTSQVWELLTTIKGDFGKFGDLLDKTRDKLVQATNTTHSARSKSRTIERKLGKVQQLADKTSQAADKVLPD
jgi:DNA recombination protein RmuC